MAAWMEDERIIVKKTFGIQRCTAAMLNGNESKLNSDSDFCQEFLKIEKNVKFF